MDIGKPRCDSERVLLCDGKVISVSGMEKESRGISVFGGMES